MARGEGLCERGCLMGVQEGLCGGLNEKGLCKRM